MIKVLELFAGIGACSKALERLGIAHEIVDAVEIDKHAIASFNAIHGTSFEPQDITKWDKDIKVDLIMHGSPCQDFSIAGRQAGGDEGSGTRSSLMYETLRIVGKLKPKYVIWENVKNILSEKHRPNFEAYQRAMADLGYKNFVQVLNAKDYGVPQNRERIFTVSILGDGDYEFLQKQPLTKCLGDILEETVNEKYYLSSQRVAGILESSYERYKRFYSPDGISPSLDTMSGGNRRLKIYRVPRGHNFARLVDEAPTITVARWEQNNFLLKIQNGELEVRKLTPKECWHLMGFDDADFEKASSITSDTQLYKQAGNSIVVNILEAILKNLLGGTSK